MAANNSVDPASRLAEQIEHGNPDLVRSVVKSMAETLMSAEADSLCGADHGTRSDERTNRRNGYRNREWDTRAGTVELTIPKLRSGSYFPGWLLERRRRDACSASASSPGNRLAGGRQSQGAGVRGRQRHPHRLVGGRLVDRIGGDKQA